jgi:hypothetical protein
MLIAIKSLCEIAARSLKQLSDISDKEGQSVSLSENQRPRVCNSGSSPRREMRIRGKDALKQSPRHVLPSIAVESDFNDVPYESTE